MDICWNHCALLNRQAKHAATNHEQRAGAGKEYDQASYPRRAHGVPAIANYREQRTE
jgi:hypothetical protein